MAAQAAASTGVGPDIMKKMLPVVAAMVMGAMAKRAGGAPAGLPGGLLDMLTPMLDRDRDGSVVDDVAGLLGTFLGGR